MHIATLAPRRPWRSRDVSDVECRDGLCRAEMHLRDMDVAKASAFAAQRELSVEALELRRDDPGELQIVAYLSPSEGGS